MDERGEREVDITTHTDSSVEASGIQREDGNLGVEKLGREDNDITATMRNGITKNVLRTTVQKPE